MQDIIQALKYLAQHMAYTQLTLASTVLNQMAVYYLNKYDKCFTEI